MRVNIFGLGYVGCVSAACLARNGHVVTGIDVDSIKVNLINDGKSPIVEPGLQQAIKSSVLSSKLTATTNGPGPADISIVCVGTPSNENGSLQLQNIRRVAKQLGAYLKTLQSYHVVNIRSTVLPGTIKKTVVPILEEESNKRAGEDFGVCMNPEFMREGTSIQDYHNPPFTLIGELDEKSGDVTAQLYGNVSAPLIRTSIEVAEMVKYACNAFHALKVSFANEIGNFCKRLGVDSHQVMDIFCQDTKLNISPSYLKPGYAFGGSCLPKDLRALLYKAKEMDLEIPVLNSILLSNTNQVEQAFRLVKNTNLKKVGVLGLSFKPDTDDLRESPMVELIEKLIGKGYQVGIYDKEVSLARIHGSNKEYIEHAIPHISCLMKSSVKEVVQDSEVLIVGNKSKEYEEYFARNSDSKIIIDLVRIQANVEMRNGLYEGICW